MFAVKEISRVALVERKWSEAGERTEFSRSPFPSISQQILNSKSAGTRSMRVDWRRVPTLEVKVPARQIGSRVAPWVFPFRTLSCAVRGALPLRLRGKFLACPARVGGSLCVTHIHRP